MLSSRSSPLSCTLGPICSHHRSGTLSCPLDQSYWYLTDTVAHTVFYMVLLTFRYLSKHAPVCFHWLSKWWKRWSCQLKKLGFILLVFFCFPQCMQPHELDFQTYLESNHSPSMTNILFQGIVIFYQIMAIALSLRFWSVLLPLPSLFSKQHQEWFSWRYSRYQWLNWNFFFGTLNGGTN